MVEYTVKDTLAFFYFGATPGDPKIIDKIIEKAYFDATMQGAFNALIQKEYKTESHKEESIECMRNAIKQLEKDKDYDEWHKDTCFKLITIHNRILNKDRRPIFTYGNAQKLVNMTMKYLHLLSNDKPATNDFFGFVQHYADDLHMPIDSYIIDALFRKKVLTWKECRENTDSCIGCLVGPRQKDPADDNKRRSEYIKIKWSNWDEYLYKAVQERIRKKKPAAYKNIIEWENDLWIEQAKRIREGNNFD